MRRFVLPTLMMSACVLALAYVPAFAAEASVPASSTAPVASPLVSTGVQWWMEGDEGQVIAIVSTELDDSVELPVRVRLPIPPGMTVDWAGEISSGGVSEDVPRDFTVTQGKEASYAEFEVSTFRVAQIDLSGKPLAGGDRVSMSLEFIQSVPSSQTAFSVRLPSGASDVSIRPAPDGPPGTNDLGESLYTLPLVTLEEGESQVTQVSYVPSGSGPLPDAGSGGASGVTTLIAVLAVIAVAAAVGLAVVIRKQARAEESAALPTPPQTGKESSPDARPVPDADATDSDEPFLVDE